MCATCVSQALPDFAGKSARDWATFCYKKEDGVMTSWSHTPGPPAPSPAAAAATKPTRGLCMSSNSTSFSPISSWPLWNLALSLSRTHAPLQGALSLSLSRSHRWADGLEAAKDAAVDVGACVVHRVVGGDNSLFLNKGSWNAGVSSVERARFWWAFHVCG